MDMFDSGGNAYISIVIVYSELCIDVGRFVFIYRYETPFVE